MYKNFVIICAEYGVIVMGIILAILALTQDCICKQIQLFGSASILLLIALAVTKILKRIIHKKRPPKRIEFFEPFDTYAFPSGHATGLFSVAFFIVSHDLMLGVVALIVSLVILYARVQSHVHDVFDMLAGACVGILITYALMPYIEHVFVPYLYISLS